MNSKSEKPNSTISSKHKLDDFDELTINFDLNIINFERLYTLLTITYSILVYSNYGILYTLPILLHLFYRFSGYNIPHFDILILIYGLIISINSSYLFISFIISTLLLFTYSMFNVVNNNE